MPKIPPVDSPNRCKWARNDPMLADYHDREWGQPIPTDDGHLERMVLEIFQCGLSWKIVMVKRPALRAAFHDFSIEKVARMGEKDVEKLLTNAAIIRNRKKIEASIENARRFRDLIKEHGSYIRWLDSLPAATPAQLAATSKLLSKTFKFMGPETTKCYLWGVGKQTPPHEPACWIKSKTKGGKA